MFCNFGSPSALFCNFLGDGGIILQLLVLLSCDQKHQKIAVFLKSGEHPTGFTINSDNWFQEARNSTLQEYPRDSWGGGSKEEGKRGGGE